MSHLLRREAAWIGSVAALLLAARILPDGLSWLSAMAAILTGPGHGFPEALFGRRYLSSPERWLLTVVFSMAIVVAATFMLLQLGFALPRSVLLPLVVALTVVSSLVSVLSSLLRRDLGDGRRSGTEPVALALGLCIGVAAAAAIWTISAAV